MCRGAKTLKRLLTAVSSLEIAHNHTNFKLPSTHLIIIASLVRHANLVHILKAAAKLLIDALATSQLA